MEKAAGSPESRNKPCRNVKSSSSSKQKESNYVADDGQLQRLAIEVGVPFTMTVACGKLLRGEWGDAN